MRAELAACHDRLRISSTRLRAKEKQVSTLNDENASLKELLAVISKEKGVAESCLSPALQGRQLVDKEAKWLYRLIFIC